MQPRSPDHTVLEESLAAFYRRKENLCLIVHSGAAGMTFEQAVKAIFVFVDK
jgi:hypothetical protein